MDYSRVFFFALGVREGVFLVSIGVVTLLRRVVTFSLHHFFLEVVTFWNDGERHENTGLVVGLHIFVRVVNLFLTE